MRFEFTLFIGFLIFLAILGSKTYYDLGEIEKDIDFMKDVSTEWIEEHIGEEVDFLHQERDSQLYVFKSKGELYKVLFDLQELEMIHILHEDKAIYERK